MLRKVAGTCGAEHRPGPLQPAAITNEYQSAKGQEPGKDASMRASEKGLAKARAAKFPQA